MCDVLKHRGPDDEGFYIDTNVSLGMRRLAIIDISTGHQPQHNEHNDIWVIFNGEIFNFMDLKQDLITKGHQFYTNSDTEVIVHSYEEWGPNLFNMIRGQFAICVYDSRKKEILLTRDPIGLKPIYYYFDGEKFIFSSEIKSILMHDIPRTIDLEGLNLYCSLRYIPFDLTLFQGIKKVPPGSFLKFNLTEKKIEIHPYFKISFAYSKNYDEIGLAKELRRLLEESVKLRLISDVPLGAFLSGGLDSSAIVALMSKYSDIPVNTFSIGFEQGAPINEMEFAKIIAEKFNTKHTELTIKSDCYNIFPKLVWHFDDLIADAAIIPVYFMAKLARSKIKVALTGDGADEIFAGYAENYWLYGKSIYNHVPKKLVDFSLRFYKNIPSHKAQIILSAIDSSIKKEDRFFKPILSIKDTEKDIMLDFKSKKVQPQLSMVLHDNLDLINQYINYDLRYQLPNLFNMKIDKMSMAASLEARVPYLDREIVQWANSIHPDLKLKGKTEKYILRLAVKDILPSPISNRKKMGFGTPMNLWLRTGMQEIAEDILERLKKRNKFIKPNYVKSVKKNLKSWLFQDRVLILIMFELWYETFFENDGRSPIKLN